MEAREGKGEVEEGPREGGSPSEAQAPLSFRYILGEKLGMTQIFDDRGSVIPVTAVRAGPCPVVAIRTPEKDGFAAVQIGFGEVREKSLSKASLGRFKRAGVVPVRYLREVRSSAAGAPGGVDTPAGSGRAPTEGFSVGQKVTLEKRWQPGDYVDVRGLTKGKGFAGVMKRHGFSGLPASHGASDKQRSPGSIASRRSLGRVIPGQRMAGHMGAAWVTVSKLEVVNVLPERHLIYIKGALPGPAGGLVIISETTKPEKKRIVRKPQKGKK